MADTGIGEVCPSILRPSIGKLAHYCVIRTDSHKRAELNSGHGGLSDTRLHCPKAHYYVVKSLDIAVQQFREARLWNRTLASVHTDFDEDIAGCRARTIDAPPVFRV